MIRSYKRALCCLEIFNLGQTKRSREYLTPLLFHFFFSLLSIKLLSYCFRCVSLALTACTWRLIFFWTVFELERWKWLHEMGGVFVYAGVQIRDCTLLRLSPCISRKWNRMIFLWLIRSPNSLLHVWLLSFSFSAALDLYKGLKKPLAWDARQISPQNSTSDGNSIQYSFDRKIFQAKNVPRSVLTRESSRTVVKLIAEGMTLSSINTGLTGEIVDIFFPMSRGLASNKIVITAEPISLLLRIPYIFFSPFSILRNHSPNLVFFCIL